MTNTDKTVFSEQHKANLSKAARGKPKSPEHKAAIAAAMKKRHEEKRQSMR